MEQQNSVKIKAEIMWAFLDKVNDMSNKYQVDLCQLSDKAAAALKSMGISVSYKEDKGNFITCKSNRPIHAYDDGGASLEGVNVGNGSKANALVSTFEWKFKGKAGISPSLKKLVITDLVEYAGGGGSLDEDDELL